MSSADGTSPGGFPRAYFTGPSGRLALLFLICAVVAAGLLIDLPEPWKEKSLARYTAGKGLALDDYIALGLWFGALANLVISGLALLTLPLWQRWANANPLPRGFAIPDRPSRRFVPLVALIVLVAAAVRLPLLDQSLLRDEEDTLRRDVWGCYREQADGTQRYEGVTWRHTLWENGGANNPVLFSILSRVSLETWQVLAQKSPERFYRPAIRFPSFLAGLAAVALLAALLWRLGYPRAGLLAALILALHPWHARYSAEGRGYSLAMACALGAFICLHAALTNRRWRDWAGFAACQFGMLWSFPGSIYLAAVQSGLAALALLWPTKKAAPCLPSLARFAFCNLFAGMVFIQLMSPCVPQMLRYLKKATVFGPMGLPWAEEFFGLLAAGVGMGYYYGQPPAEFGPLLDLSRWSSQWGTLLFVCGVLPALAVVGAVRWARIDGRARVLLAASILGPVLGFVQNKMSGHYLYPWYLIYALPPAMAMIGLGLDWIGGKRRLQQLLVWGAFFAVFWLDSYPWREVLRRGKGKPEDQIIRGSNVYVIHPDGYILHRYRPPK